MVRTVNFNDIEITYTFTYKRVKNINLRIKKDGSVMVSAPERISLSVIDNFIISKGNYILSAIEYFDNRKNFEQKEINYIDGDILHILGECYILKLIESDNESVYLDENYIYFNVLRINDFNEKQKIYDRFIRQSAKEIYSEIAKKVYAKFNEYKIPFPEIRIRNMTSRWGSCQTVKKIITMNLKLIEAPESCIEYVMIHEFCHLVHPDHSKNFYNLMEKILPDWKAEKSLLEKNIY